nr:MAG TPA: hypothetical protein [Caudoviricetes sp.]
MQTVNRSKPRLYSVSGKTPTFMMSMTVSIPVRMKPSKRMILNSTLLLAALCMNRATAISTRSRSTPILKIRMKPAKSSISAAAIVRSKRSNRLSTRITSMAILIKSSS